MNRENIYLLKAIVETKLGIKTPKLHHGRRSGVFIVKVKSTTILLVCFV